MLLPRLLGDGAGNSTVLLGEHAQHKGGALTSIDITEKNCRLAREMTRSIPCVNIVCGDSITLLESFSGEIGLLYLDSMDTFVSGSAEHALREFEAALPHLHERSIVAFDDTAYGMRGYRGKGALTVPHMLAHGWRLLFSGYQTVLDRT